MPTNVIENHKFIEIKNALADNIKEIFFYYLFLLICYLFIYICSRSEANRGAR